MSSRPPSSPRYRRLPSGAVAHALALALVLALGLASGCVFLKSPSAPLRVLPFTPKGPANAEGVILVLPGLGDGPSDFEANGLVRTALERTAYDVLAPDLHFGYYRQFSVIERLHEDVVTRARALGYRKVWLLGVS